MTGGARYANAPRAKTRCVCGHGLDEHSHGMYCWARMGGYPCVCERFVAIEKAPQDD